MDEAVVVFSRKGLFQTRVTAREVHSHEHARKMWPLVAPGAIQQMVTWVSSMLETRTPVFIFHQQAPGQAIALLAHSELWIDLARVFGKSILHVPALRSSDERTEVRHRRIFEYLTQQENDD